MAIRKSITEEMIVAGKREDWLNQCRRALENGGFKRINVSEKLFQVTANYIKVTVWGEIRITLLPEGDNTRVQVIATANVDNIFALFRSPGKHIIKRFKEGL